MRLERANAKAIRYAILKWHYSRSVPMVQVGYAVFNEAGEWCGVICYGIGANNHIGSPYGLATGQIAELVRVALNGKQESTSKALALSLKLIKKDCPLLQMLVSYADTGQEHVGTIYQATNWVYTGRQKVTDSLIDPVTGKVTHGKTINSVYGSQIGLQKVKGTDKLKYIYPLTKEMRKRAETLRQPYPKKEYTSAGSSGVERPDTIGEDGGSNPTSAL